MKALTYVEIDVPICGLIYGVAPCTAAGTDKCFNTKASCQDRENFDETTSTLRFAKPTSYLPNDIRCIPSIREVESTPAIISLGENLGQRATVKITFTDHPHSDVGFLHDPYLDDRTYNPYNQGSFWGKFRARQKFIQGRRLRLIRGTLGQALGDMETRHYVVESFEGPNLDGEFTIVAQDVLKLADNDRTRAPSQSNGYLTSDIDDDENTCTLSPVGIGNAEYPSSGQVVIGGRELVGFTRSGDTLTLDRFTNMLEYGIEAMAHKAGDRVQLVLRYNDESPADIIYDLLTTYANIDPSFINLDAWQSEIDTFLPGLYSAFIAEPTGVTKLISELIEQSAISLWWDDVEQQIKLRVLRTVITLAERFTEDNVLRGTLSMEDKTEKRLSRVITYFGQISPIKGVEDIDNYRCVEITTDDEAEEDYGVPSIKTIFSRWIPADQRVVARKLNQTQLARFRDPPRRFKFSMFKGATSEILLGGGYRVESRKLQDFTGASTNAPIQVTSLRTTDDKFVVEGEEVLFKVQDPGDLTNRVIVIDTDTMNFNLRGAHDSIFPPVTEGDVGTVTLTCIVQSGVIVGSTATAIRAFNVGDWPSGFDITVRVLGRIQGRGGNGGNVIGFTPQNGSPGGVALYTRHAIDLEVEGEVWGGGGGGAANFVLFFGFGGCGGAGQLPGIGGNGVIEGEFAPDGTTEAGGTGENGEAAGGDPGEAGANSVSATGGAAGAAIDGISYVTVTVGPGDRRGPEIN